MPREACAKGGERGSPKEEGAALLIVMFVLLTTTATAMFAIHATSFEIRAAGHARQAMQTQYVAETGLTAAMALVDDMGAAAILHAMQNSNAPTMEPFEPELFEGKRGYRLYLDDFDALSNEPVTRESLGGSTQVYEPLFIVDLNDHYTYTGVIPGQRSDGYGRLQYMHATYTSRGRTRIAGGDVTGSIEGDREYHEGASDARAYGLSGPFGR